MSGETRIRITFIFLLTFLSQGSEAQQIGKKAELESYLANRNNFQEYSCAMSVEYVQVYPDPDFCSCKDEWFVHCLNAKEKKQRFEFSPQFNSQGPGIPETGDMMFVFDGKVLRLLRGSSKPRSSVDLSKLENDEELIEPRPFCSPFEVPFFAGSSFANRSIYDLRTDSLKRVFDRFEKTDDESVHDGLKVKYKITPKYEVFADVFFDDKVGEMPTLNVTKDPPRNTVRLMANWFDTGKGWLPKKVDIAISFGDPKKPTSTRNWEVTYYWMLSVPKKAWETDYQNKGLTAWQLRELIIANAIKMK